MGVTGELTSVEKALVAHVCSGEPLDLIPKIPKGKTIDEHRMRAWRHPRTIRATVIRAILRGRHAAHPDPHGLRLRGAWITGRLDLENLSTDINFELTDCLLEQGILAREARMGSVRLRGCRLEHPTDPPLDAAGLACSALDLSRATIIGHTAGKPGEADPPGAVHLLGARIRGHLDCTGAKLCNDKGPALLADGVRVGLGMFLRRGFTATGAGQDGAVMLRGASVGIHLVCSGASLRNDTGPALSADGLQVAQDMYLDEEFTAAGTVNLTSADISGQLSCRGAQLNGTDENGNALLGERMKVGGDVFLEKFTTTAGAVCLLGADISGKLSCRGAQLNGCDKYGNALHGEGMKVGDRVLLEEKFTAAGAVSLLAADISGQLSCRGAQLNGTDENGNALLGERMKVGGDVLLEEKFTAAGVVRLPGAHIGGGLDCTGAQLRNDSGPALVADNLQVDQNMSLSGGFTATSNGDGSAVNLTFAHIGGNLDCTGAQLSNDSGSGLLAYGLQVDQNMYLSGGFTAIARGRAAVRLTDAHIGGNLDCHGASMRNDSGPALLAYGVQVGQDMYLTEGFTATGAGEGKEVTVNLRAARVSGAFHFEFEEERLKHQTDSRRRLSVDGLTYPGVPRRISAQDWRKLLWDGTPYYAAQPYQQLAAGCRALGDDRQARETLMKQRDDQLARTHPRRRERLWGWITKVTLGYGYKPWRALWFLAAVVAASCALAWLLGAHGALTQTDKTATPDRSCTVVQQVSVGLDLNLPVGTSVARAKCDLTKHSASWTAFWLTVAGWVLRVLAWVFAALFIAGFTGAVRKT